MQNKNIQDISISASHQIATNPYSKTEELANTSSHAIGVIFGIVGLVSMILIADGDILRLSSSLIYGTSIIALFLTSTLYHSVKKESLRMTMKTLDHCAIYLLIAGSYTPYMMISLQNHGGFIYLTIIWSIALLGILFKIFLGHQFPKTSLVSYIAMGWFVVIAASEMIENVSKDGLILLAASGACYTIGAVFYAWKKLIFNHAIWHLFVLAGATLNFLSVYWHVLPKSTPIIN